jgi:hypothetical protein
MEQSAIATEVPPRKAMNVLETTVPVRRIGPRILAPVNTSWVLNTPKVPEAGPIALIPLNDTPASPMAQLRVAFRRSPWIVLVLSLGEKSKPAIAPSHVTTMALASVVGVMMAYAVDEPSPKRGNVSELFRSIEMTGSGAAACDGRRLLLQRTSAMAQKTARSHAQE